MSRRREETKIRVSEYRISGLTLKRSCDLHNESNSWLRNWMGKFSRESMGSSAFIPLNPSPRQSIESGPVEVFILMESGLEFLILIPGEFPFSFNGPHVCANLILPLALNIDMDNNALDIELAKGVVVYYRLSEKGNGNYYRRSQVISCSLEKIAQEFWISRSEQTIMASAFRC